MPDMNKREYSARNIYVQVDNICAPFDASIPNHSLISIHNKNMIQYKKFLIISDGD
jgi:hypothetical protein